jgi:hypothetical protein
LVLLNVPVGVFISQRNPVRVGGLVGGELDAEVMTDLRAGVAAEVRQGLPFLLSHAIALASRVLATACHQPPLPTGCRCERRMPSWMSLWSRMASVVSSRALSAPTAIALNPLMSHYEA